jgi:RNA polymerase sigma-70 factor, ECF subfamily
MTAGAAMRTYTAIVDADPQVARRDLDDEIAALHPRLLRFAFVLTRDRQAAEDLTQDTMARALGAAWRFTPGTNLEAWLFRIMRNLQLNRIRDGAAQPRVESLEDVLEAAHPSDLRTSPVERRAIDRADLALVRDAFGALPEKYALPILLTSVEGLSYAEAADVIGVPVGTIMSRIHRGRHLLLARVGGRLR